MYSLSLTLLTRGQFTKPNRETMEVHEIANSVRLPEDNEHRLRAGLELIKEARLLREQERAEAAYKASRESTSRERQRSIG